MQPACGPVGAGRRRPADDVEDRPFLVKAKLAETGAPLAGEMSGHIFFKERWYGFDDGLYTGARLLEIVSRHADACAPLEALPQDVSTPELKLEMEEGQPFTLVRALQDHGQFPGASRVVTIDGVRAEYPDGFGLARPPTPRQWWCCASKPRAPKHWPVSRPISAGNWLNWRQVLLCPSRTCQCNCPIALPGNSSLQLPTTHRVAASNCGSSTRRDCAWT